MTDLKTSLPQSSPINDNESLDSQTDVNAAVEVEGVKANQVPPSPTNIAGPTGGTTAASSVAPTKPTSVIPTATKPGLVAAKLTPAPTSLAGKVNNAQGAGMQIPKGLTGIDTSKPAPDAYDYFHGIIYASTSARKSTTAAKMFGAENTLIVLCRQPEQLIPLRGMGYKVLHAETDEALVFALTYPEKAAAVLLNWPEWAGLKDRAIVFDDVTEGVTLLLDRHSTKDDGTERKDPRQIYKFAGAELKDLFTSLRRKKLHLIIVALAKVTNNDWNEEIIAPDLPPSMAGFMTTDVEFVFYIDKSKWKFVTDAVYRSYLTKDEKGKDKTVRREIFGKNKLPGKFVNRGVFPATNEVSMSKTVEGPDLATIWAAVKSGTPIEAIPVVGAKK